MFFNVFQSLIVLLYILDNETNTVVIISVFVGERRRVISRGMGIVTGGGYSLCVNVRCFLSKETI